MNSYYRKEFGQNFLKSRKYAVEVVDSADIQANDVVIEIGPGAGMLTQSIIQKAKRVIAIEIDERFVEILKSRFQEDIISKKFKTIHEDVLKVNIEDLDLKEYKVIGALPYNISKRIIKKFLELENPPHTMTFIIQKEVAEDYSAVVPKATFLSNYTKVFAEVDFIKVIPKELFKPKPKVDGAIIKFKMTNVQLSIPKRKRFTKFLKSAFMNPRKKLINNLNGIYKVEKEKLLKFYKEIGIEENARASNLLLKQWKELHQKISKNV